MEEKGSFMLPDLRRNAPGLYEIPARETVNVTMPETIEGMQLQQKQKAVSGVVSGSSSWAYACWYTGVNFLFGLLGALFLFLCLPVLALGIYLDSPGPIFYTQERLGYRRKPFRIYKLRSMQVDAEPDGMALWASKDDERVTRLGRFLRMTHLDELPQVLNILRGDMALIGPRPQREAFAVRLELECPVYRERLMVKPGLTGWAQVKYGYGAGSGEWPKLHYDLEYIQRRSIRLDLLILLKTVAEVFTLRGR